MASSRDHKFIEAAAVESYKSPCQMRHGCVAVCNGRILARGHNHYRNYSQDGLIHNTCTCHAEIAAIRNLHKTYNVGQGKVAM